MKYNVQFQEITKQVDVNFGEVNNISDGGYERGLEEGQKKGYKTGYTEGEEKGYTAGYSKGETNGYNNGYSDGVSSIPPYEGEYEVELESGQTKRLLTAGKVCNDDIVVSAASSDSFYDTFWDGWQDYGNRTNYPPRGFTGFDDNNFKPKYDIRLSGNCQYLFSGSGITNLKALLENAGVTLDTSGAKDLWYLARENKITHLPTIVARAETNLRFIWSWCDTLEYVEKFVINASKAVQTTGNYPGMIINGRKCWHFIVEGTIYGHTEARSQPFNLESALSFINALENYAGTEDEFKFTLTFSPTTWGYLDAEGKASPNGNSWREYINDLGWNAS